MKMILLSGGSGKRLWPLSNDVRSKQFLKLFAGLDGGQQSMVQRVYKQIKEALPGAEIVVATNAAQVDSIHGQLGHGVDIVIEPERRDTYPAIALACAYFFYKKNADPDETVVVLPVDPFTELGYFETLHKITSSVSGGYVDITLMGIKPTLATSKYGYIVAGNPISDDAFAVSRFVEKPDYDVAEALVRAGAFWNGGVFAFKLGYMMDITHTAVSFASFEGLKKKYGELEKISFDYAVVEKTKRIAMVPYGGKWTDLGTWRTLADEIETKSLGNAVLEDAENTFVVNELNIPIVALGTKDLIVAASADGILVSDITESFRIKPIVDRLEAPPMYKEHSWGESTVYDNSRHADDKRSLVKNVFVKAGMEIEYQSHALRDEVWVITHGEARFALDGTVQNISSGSVLTIPKGAKHALRAVTDTSLIEIQLGETLSEEDASMSDWRF
jgi:mannose-1-phosphate guanylyltransferase